MKKIKVILISLIFSQSLFGQITRETIEGGSVGGLTLGMGYQVVDRIQDGDTLRYLSLKYKNKEYSHIVDYHLIILDDLDKINTMSRKLDDISKIEGNKSDIQFPLEDGYSIYLNGNMVIIADYDLGKNNGSGGYTSFAKSDAKSFVKRLDSIKKYF